MPLPLPVRKNIRDSEESKKENLERIKNATGKDFELEVDWEGVVAKVDEWAKTQIGDIYQKEILGYLADNIENNMKTETTKEAFNEATSQNKITIGINDKQDGYWALKIVDGVLALTHKASICNNYDVHNYNLVSIIPSPGLPLSVRLNLEENREKLEENLQRINEATGASDWTFEADFEKLLPMLDGEYQRNSIGDMYYKECLGYLADAIETACKDETLKEALVEASNQHKIIFVGTNNPKVDKYWDIKFENGTIKVTHKAPLCNTYDIHNYNLAAVVPSGGVLSMLARLNINESQEKLQQHLETFKEATGEEYTFDDSCLEACFKNSTQEYTKNNVGSQFMDEALGYLAANFKDRCADDMVKEAINETVTSRQISFVPNPKAANYWDVKFTNGNVVITYKPDPCNVYDLRNFDIEKLL